MSSRTSRMTRGWLTRMAVAVVVATIPGCSTLQTPVQNSASRVALRAEIDSLNRAMIAAFDSSPAKVARFYMDSARIVGPRRQTVAGRQAIDRYWASITGPAQWSLTVVEVGGERESIHQVGVSRLTSARRDGTSQTYECDFVVLWKRQPDGSLRITLDLYN